jgi:hypothetical protein
MKRMTPRQLMLGFTTVLALVEPLGAQGAPLSTQTKRVETVERQLEVTDALRKHDSTRLKAVNLKHQTASTFLNEPLRLEGAKLKVPNEQELKDYLDALQKAYEDQPSNVKDQLEFTPGLAGSTSGASIRLPNAGFISPDILLDGVADYLVLRAKREATGTYLRTLKETLDSNTYLKRLLPNTLSLLSEIEQIPANAVLGGLQAAARSDLQVMPDSIVGLFGETSNPEWYSAAQISRILIRNQQRGDTPLNSIAALARVGSAEVKSVRVRLPLRFLGQLAQEIKLRDGKMPPALEDDRLRKYFVAFVLHDAFDGQTDLDAAVAKTMVEKLSDVSLVRVREISISIKSVLDEAARLKAAPADSKVESLLAIANSTLKLASFSANNAVEVFFPDDVSARRFGQAFTAMTQLLVAGQSRDYASIVAIAMQGLQHIESNKTMPPQGRQLLRLISTIAEAKSAEDISNLLWAVAEPVGSFKAKRTQKGHDFGKFSLNSYLGVALTMESTVRASEGRDLFPMFHAPIGLEVNFLRFRNWSASAFVPMLNLGNLVASRFGADSVAVKPEIGFSQLVSQGAYLVIGITRNIPLSVGLGVDYVPQLRRQLSNGTRIDVTRTSVFMAMDMPLYFFSR